MDHDLVHRAVVRQFGDASSVSDVPGDELKAFAADLRAMAEDQPKDYARRLEGLRDDTDGPPANATAQPLGWNPDDEAALNAAADEVERKARYAAT